MINRDNAGENTVKVERILGAERFEQTGSARYTVTGNVMDITLPLEAVVFDDPKDPHFNFKLSDNLQTDGDIMDFYKNGDVAPGGRFMFVY